MAVQKIVFCISSNRMKLLSFILLLFTFNSCKQKHGTSNAKKLPGNPVAVSVIQKDYALCKSSVVKLKQQNRANWAHLNASAKEKIFVAAVTDSIAPSWMGTDWGFYGTTQIPRQGNIACGYFVTTVLQDAGLPIARTRLAQCASEEMIRTLVQPSLIQRYSNVPVEDFANNIKQQGFGLYIIGLDTHTGFIYNDGKDVYFIHASYTGAKKVTKEKALDSWILKSSKYRITGKISGDTRALDKWMNE